MSDGGSDSDVTDEDLWNLQNRITNAAVDVADATTAATKLSNTGYPEHALRGVHTELRSVHNELGDALDRTEQYLQRLDSGVAAGVPTPRETIREHAERVDEQYDPPVRYLALELLEHNRRRWLQGRPKTNGARDVSQHGFTGSQRMALDKLQEAWEAHDDA